MADFDQLGLNEQLVANAAEAGFDAPSELQRSVIPVLRRGGNAIVRAASGSGITAAYALALLDRFGDADGTRALVVVPTGDRAEKVARTIAQLGIGTNARVTALTSAWSGADDATIIVASAEKLLAAVAESQLKLDEVESVVIDGAAAINSLVPADTFERIFASLPKEGQRVFVSSAMTDAVRKLAEAHARKALTFPPRPAVEARAETPETTWKLNYVVTAPDRKADPIARFARSRGGEITLVARSQQSARNGERELQGRGFHVNAARFEDFDRDAASGAIFAYDVPFSAEQLQRVLRNGDTVVVARTELAHLKMIAEEVSAELVSATLPSYETDSLNAFRNEIRRAAREEDIEAMLLVLEPLMQELSPEEIAAAACALLRARRPAKAEAATAKPGMKTWSRLFLSVGERDGVRPADIVGAITGESGIRGDEVGKVEIRDTFCVVEVASTVADKVISSMNGTTMKNRSLRVDYDRKTTAGGSRGGPRGGPRDGPRGGPRDGPRGGPRSGQRGRPDGPRSPRAGPRSPTRRER
jgi:ATP-dependent RNA helicase DeaD